VRGKKRPLSGKKSSTFSLAGKKGSKEKEVRSPLATKRSFPRSDVSRCLGKKKKKKERRASGSEKEPPQKTTGPFSKGGALKEERRLFPFSQKGAQSVYIGGRKGSLHDQYAVNRDSGEEGERIPVAALRRGEKRAVVA